MRSGNLEKSHELLERLFAKKRGGLSFLTRGPLCARWAMGPESHEILTTLKRRMFADKRQNDL